VAPARAPARPRDPARAAAPRPGRPPAPAAADDFATSGAAGAAGGVATAPGKLERSIAVPHALQVKSAGKRSPKRYFFWQVGQAISVMAGSGGKGAGF
jgi:hypothetical protein